MSKEVILGISYSHNSSACLMDMDGNLIFASSEERFTKNKNDLGIPKESINYILNNFLNVHITAICVGDKLDMQCSTADYLNYFYFENYKRRNFVFLKKKFLFVFIILKEIIFRFIKKKVSAKNVFERNLRSLGLKSKVYYFDHHYSHACSAYYSNNFNGGHVLTMDGEGNGISGSFWNVNFLRRNNYGAQPCNMYFRASTARPLLGRFVVDLGWGPFRHFCLDFCLESFRSMCCRALPRTRNCTSVRLPRLQSSGPHRHSFRSFRPRIHP
jgi:predicted NodU family carbamoyl transferase